MIISIEIKNNIINLLTDVTKTEFDKLETKAIDSLINKLETSVNPDQVQHAWLPILEIVNTKYWFKKWDDTRDDRRALGSLLQACKDSLELSSNIQIKNLFAEQIAKLHLVYANLIHLYPSGHPVVYKAYCDTMQQANTFIHENNLINTEAYALWNFLEASSALKSCNVKKQELKVERANLSLRKNELLKLNDEGKLSELESEIQERIRTIQIVEEDLLEYVRVGQKCIDAAIAYGKLGNTSDLIAIKNRFTQINLETNHSPSPVTNAYKIFTENRVPIVLGAVGMVVVACMRKHTM